MEKFHRLFGYLSPLSLPYNDEVFKKGHLGEDTNDLICSAHALSRDLMGFFPCDLFLFKIDAPGIRLKHSRDEVKQGSFSCAIWTNQSGDGARFNVKGTVIQRHHLSEFFYHLFDP